MVLSSDIYCQYGKENMNNNLQQRTRHAKIVRCESDVSKDEAHLSGIWDGTTAVMCRHICLQ